jgi:serine phosphatase RsbU (regulator of sigma subunit)
MGLFEAWHCEIVEVELAPGDTLLLYTDGSTEAGSTEAANADVEEFGESRLLDALASHSPCRRDPFSKQWPGGPAIQLR